MQLIWLLTNKISSSWRIFGPFCFFSSCQGESDSQNKMAAVLPVVGTPLIDSSSAGGATKTQYNRLIHRKSSEWKKKTWKLRERRSDKHEIFQREINAEEKRIWGSTVCLKNMREIIRSSLCWDWLLFSEVGNKRWTLYLLFGLKMRETERLRSIWQQKTKRASRCPARRKTFRWMNEGFL